jgi:hypothetical protein
VHLLLGHPQDPCCQGVRAALEARDLPVRIVADPLAHPSRFAWRLDNERSASQLGWDEEPPVADEHISGVLVRSTGWIDPSGWRPEDLAYVQAETQAALLGWLWSLPCPVVNRYSPAMWYLVQVPLLFWQPLLRRCGLPTLETLVTNVEEEARAFGRRLAREGVAGTVYGPLTSDAHYLVADGEEWSGLAAMQGYAPVCLTYPHEAPQLVCVLGERVIWQGEPSSEVALLEPALRRFARAAGLVFVELALAPTSNGVRTIAVEPRPHFERFMDAARRQIVEGLVQLLTAGAGRRRDEPEQVSSHGSLS